ncbi:23S rRNA m(5)U-1939 methyltransferase [Alkalispirochaeta americana]|uniref:23S rRNA m(5)U-1939 methyltransferase n=1 Tax=Alkalispirochaeta americana TaxID=159291 RepID=A0A1N6RAL8_9SPIO|nr:23S rRNA (uracil(1939)-C(5))-methyltransferase RlmD [Alkalispirochaeta americana]SIQ25878.1 23S rRNA m(5)U-1939 methyltransferase [Alkalispirochaeta americana]
MKRELTGIRISRVDSRGRGRGIHTLSDGQERSVAVPGALPGDLIDVGVRGRKAGTIQGCLLALHETSHPRREPRCPHFGSCGGCTLQDISYADQLLLKQGTVEAAFREAELTELLPEMTPILASPREFLYRNKLEFSFGAERWLDEEEILRAEAIPDRRGLGFHAPGRFDRVLDLRECHLQPDPSEAIRSFLGDLARERGYSFYHAREHRGFLRLLIIRTSLTGDLMVTIMFGEDDQQQREELLQALGEAFPEITSLNYVVNTSKNDSIYPHQVVLWRGEPFITEQCGDLRLRIHPKAFYQTNPEQALRLYQAAVALAHLRPEDLLFDLYSGIGSIALYAAGRVRRVVGIESVEDAVEAARENARGNGIGNALFESGEVEKILPQVISREGAPRVVMVDPPRAGMHPAARKALATLAPETIVYISCNPRTQAADLREFIPNYEIAHLQPVDMFPQTRHVENIVLLRRR